MQCVFWRKRARCCGRIGLGNWERLPDSKSEGWAGYCRWVERALAIILSRENVCRSPVVKRSMVKKNLEGLCVIGSQAQEMSWRLLCVCLIYREYSHLWKAWVRLNCNRYRQSYGSQCFSQGLTEHLLDSCHCPLWSWKRE